MEDLKRFIKYIKIIKNGCWEWQGARDIDGYGYFKYKKAEHAHRSSYKIFNNKKTIKKGMQIDHLCRNRACVNPDHLELVTPRENTLRGLDSRAAINARKTHCLNGHAFTEENTYYHIRKTPKRNNGKLSKRPERMCKTCQRDRKKLRAKYARQQRIANGEIIKMGPALLSHCKRGHEYNEVNTAYDFRGWRYCKPCAALKAQRYRAKQLLTKPS